MTKNNARQQTTQNHQETQEQKILAKVISDQPKAQGSQQERAQAQPSAEDLMRLKERFGTDDLDFFNSILVQMVRANAGNKKDVDFFISVLKNEKPKTHFDMMLAAQATANHVVIMKLIEQVALTDNLVPVYSLIPAIAKLQRLFIDQHDALARRASGPQTVSVQNVSVSEGGQAVVANINQNETPRENIQNKPAAATPLAITDAKLAPMPLLDESNQHAAVPAQRISPRYRPTAIAPRTIMAESKEPLQFERSVKRRYRPS
jgi:hypothetical protein